MSFLNSLPANVTVVGFKDLADLSPAEYDAYRASVMAGMQDYADCCAERDRLIEMAGARAAAEAAFGETAEVQPKCEAVQQARTRRKKTDAA